MAHPLDGYHGLGRVAKPARVEHQVGDHGVKHVDELDLLWQAGLEHAAVVHHLDDRGVLEDAPHQRHVHGRRREREGDDLAPGVHAHAGQPLVLHLVVDGDSCHAKQIQRRRRR